MDLKINYKAFNVSVLLHFYLMIMQIIITYFIMSTIKNGCFKDETAVMYLSTI